MRQHSKPKYRFNLKQEETALGGIPCIRPAIPHSCIRPAVGSVAQARGR